MSDQCEHNKGTYSRGNVWFCSGCEQSVPEPEMPESVRQHCEDWQNLSREDYCKKYTPEREWDGLEFPRTFRRLGFWKSVMKYGFKRTCEAFDTNPMQGNRVI